MTPLLKLGDSEKARRHHCHLLAVACLETAVELEEDVRGEVQNRLSELVPPRNITDAKAIASAGDLALPYLGAKLGRTVSVAAACVRALSIIGGEGALVALEKYGDDPRVGVWQELSRAWDSFDRREFAQRVLSRALVANRTLRLRSASSLEGIEVIDRLHHLDLSDGKITDAGLPHLSALTGLQSLSLWNTQITDAGLAHLSGCTNLKILETYGGKVTEAGRKRFFESLKRGE